MVPIASRPGAIPARSEIATARAPGADRLAIAAVTSPGPMWTKNSTPDSGHPFQGLGEENR